MRDSGSAHPVPPVPDSPLETPAPARPAPAAVVVESKIWEVLRTCYDPEIPLNIVDLGLVYDVSIQEARVGIRMTLTAPGCPLAGQIVSEVQTKVLEVEGVGDVQVDLVWDPPWTQEMITEAGKLELGLM